MKDGNDPYRACLDECPHDLAAGVLVADLLAHDGPHEPRGVVLTMRFRPRPTAGLAEAS